mgnify:CR=1 FL=1
MYSKINQIRYELEKLYESQGLTNDVLKLSRALDEKINKLQKEKGIYIVIYLHFQIFLISD